MNRLTGSFNRSIIRSIQRGTITVTGAASNTATISSVNMAKSVVHFLGFKHNSTMGFSTTIPWFPHLALTSATVVTATLTGTGPDVTVSFEVVEYN